MTDSESNQEIHNNPGISDVLHHIRNTIHRHLVVTHHEATAMTLWAAYTHGFKNFDISPRLALNSPERRCGKSHGLKLVRAFCFKPVFTENISKAAFYRAIDEFEELTFCIDEADTFVANGDRELIGIINGGHSKDGGVIRCTGDDFTASKFSSFTPVVLAGIGKLPDTIEDRSIKVYMQRKAPGEVVERMPIGFFEENERFRDYLTAWFEDKSTVLKSDWVEPPSIGNDRAKDNWLPLFTITKLVSDYWYEQCLAAYLAIEEVEDDLPLQTQLLSDVRDVFLETGNPSIQSSDLVDKLTAMIDKPWSDYKGRGINANGVAQLLRNYRIRPKTIRVGDRTPKGYERSQCEDAFNRYLPPLE